MLGTCSVDKEERKRVPVIDCRDYSLQGPTILVMGKILHDMRPHQIDFMFHGQTLATFSVTQKPCNRKGRGPGNKATYEHACGCGMQLESRTCYKLINCGGIIMVLNLQSIRLQIFPSHCRS